MVCAYFNIIYEPTLFYEFIQILSKLYAKLLLSVRKYLNMKSEIFPLKEVITVYRLNIYLFGETNMTLFQNGPVYSLYFIRILLFLE